ncbi:hypothetical protein [Mycolicibacterium palauense]|uniref:hypothetical protein n=1 Tax=Mycolicibacterium palauense TaxID=2034511 RepID=UPI001FE407A7|nr:hypothetical protein [Mycolicibacterium palauense]
MKNHARAAAAAVVLAVVTGQLTAPVAWADPEPAPAPPSLPVAGEQPAAQETGPAPTLHNVTYRARVDGISRGALITYKINDTQVRSADPTMLPGRTFEAQTVLDDPNAAGMRIRIQWPYSANLHCEILVDDATVAQADQFIAPRLTPARDDPDYGVLMCGAPLIGTTGDTGDAGGGGTPTTAADPAAPVSPEPAAGQPA